MLDFLKEIVEAVPDPSAGGTIDLESQNAERRKRGKARKADGPTEPATRKRRQKKDGDETMEGGEQDGDQELEDATMDEGGGDIDDGSLKPPRHQSKSHSQGDDEPTDGEDAPYMPKR